MPERFVPFTVSVCGLSELTSFRSVGVTHVLSILDPDYPSPSVFGQFGEHARLELRFDDIVEPFAGMVAPQQSDVERILAFGRTLAGEAGVGHLLVHCHAGVSRSTASLIMILAQAVPDLPAYEAVEAVVKVRPQAWPNLRMIEFADDLLDRNGELVEAVHKRHHAYGLAHPDFALELIGYGRGREVFWLDDNQHEPGHVGLIHNATGKK